MEGGKQDVDSNSQNGNLSMCSKLKNFAMPLIFLGALVFSIITESVLPNQLKSALYTISLAIKELLVFCLPFIIFALVVNSITKLGTKAFKYIAIILPLVCTSNFCNTMLSYFTSRLCLSSDWIIGQASRITDTLHPAFTFHIPSLISNDIALLSGVISGLILGIIDTKRNEAVTKYLDNLTKIFFRLLIPVMPIFIIGTMLKLQSDGVLISILKNYLPILIIFICAAFGMVTIQLAILSKCKLATFIGYIKNIIPALVTAFGSMSSVAAMPMSIKGAEKNVKDKKNAHIIIPCTVNMHLVGDCFFIPLVALSVMTTFGQEIPTLEVYTLFALHFILAKFAVAAVPGGGVLVMLPILEHYLGLNTDMIGLTTAIYILFDPIITTCNVAGNSAIAIMFDKQVERLRLNTKKEASKLPTNLKPNE